MPHVLNAGGACGKDFVNPAPTGDLDGVTLVLGHGEIGDKCAWVEKTMALPTQYRRYGATRASMASATVQVEAEEALRHGLNAGCAIRRRNRA